MLKNYFLGFFFVVSHFSFAMDTENLVTEEVGQAEQSQLTKKNLEQFFMFLPEVGGDDYASPFFGGLLGGCGCFAILIGSAMTGSKDIDDTGRTVGMVFLAIGGFVIFFAALIPITANVRKQNREARNLIVKNDMQSMLFDTNDRLLSPSFKTLMSYIIDRNKSYVLRYVDVNQAMMLAQHDSSAFKKFLMQSDFDNRIVKELVHFNELLEQDDLQLKKSLTNQKVQALYKLHPSILATLIYLKKDVHSLRPTFLEALQNIDASYNEKMLTDITESGRIDLECYEEEEHLCSLISELNNFDSDSDLDFVHSLKELDREKIAIVVHNFKEHDFSQKLYDRTLLRSLAEQTKTLLFLQQVIDSFKAANPRIVAEAWSIMSSSSDNDVLDEAIPIN